MQFERFLFTEPVSGQPTRLRVDLRMFQKQKDYTNLTTYIVQQMTTAVLQSQAHGHETCQVHVLTSGFTKKHSDLQYLIYIIKLLQTAFVDRLDKCYFHDPPQFLVNLWQVVSKVLDKDTKQKLKIVQGDQVSSFASFTE